MKTPAHRLGGIREKCAWRYAAVLAIAIAFATAFAPTLPVAFERDEGEYAHAADLLRAGDVPYRDTFLQKPPGIILLYAAVQSIAGGAQSSATPAHAVALFAYVATLVLVAVAANALAGARAVVPAALLAALAFLSRANEPYTANTETFLAVAATAAYALLVHAARDGPAPGSDPAKVAAVSGLCLGIAAIFKQVAVFHGPHLLLGWWLVARPTRRTRATLMMFACGAALPYALAMAWWWWRGAFGSFLECVLLHNLRYVSMNAEGPAGFMLSRHVAEMSRFDLGLWISAAVGLAALVAARRWWAAFVAGGWLFTATIGVAAGGYFRGHYFLQAVPPLALTVAIATSLLPRVVGPALVFGLAASWVATKPLLIGVEPAVQSFHRYGGLRFQNSPAIGRLLRDQAKGVTGATLFVMGSEPQLYHESGLRAVSRWTIFSPLTSGYPGSHELQEQVWREVYSAMPDFIVVSVPSSVPLFRHSDFYLYERVVALVRERYRPIAKTSAMHLGLIPPGLDLPQDFRPDLWIYRRTDAAAGAVARTARIDWPPNTDLREMALPGTPEILRRETAAAPR